MNVILITVDSLRADHVGYMGYKRKTTPSLDKFAKNGLIFKNAISCGPDTPTSIVPMMTSSYVLSYYILKTKGLNLKTTVDEFEMMRRIMPNIYKYETTIAKMLKRNGYITAGFHSNPYLSRYYNFGLEFDYFYDSLSLRKYGLKQKIKSIVEKYKILYDVSWFIYKNVIPKFRCLISKHYAVPYERANRINDRVVKWLKGVKNRKFFLWIHYMDVHFPYFPPEDFLTVDIDTTEIVDLNSRMLKNPESLSEDDIQNIVNLYDDAIRYWDYEFGRLIDEFDDLSVLDDSIIIVTADHGDEFGDHGDFAHHHAKLYEELIHVPLVMNIAKGKVEETVSLIDIAPTIANLLNIRKPLTFQGKSLLPIAFEGKSRGGVISESLIRGKRNVCYRTNDWKYILDSYRKREEVYNIRLDPLEKHNLIDDINVTYFRKVVFEHIDKKVIRVKAIIKLKNNI